MRFAGHALRRQRPLTDQQIKQTNYKNPGEIIAYLVSGLISLLYYVFVLKRFSLHPNKRPTTIVDRVNPPNLFHFSTSEPAQNAFLGWLLAWADSRWKNLDPDLHR